MRFMQGKDVVVAGGGPSGVVAAIAAARNGADVMLIERYGFLGGMTTAGLVGPWMSFHSRDGAQVIEGIPQEIVDRLVAEGGSPGHQRDTIGEAYSVTPIDPETVKHVMEEMLLESGAHVLYHCWAVDALVQGGGLRGVVVQTKSGRVAIPSTVTIDATGDGDVAAMAGADFEFGEGESRSVQPVSLMFRLSGVDMECVRDYMIEHPEEFHHRSMIGDLGRIPLSGVSGFKSIWKEGQIQGAMNIGRGWFLFFQGLGETEVVVNSTRVASVDPTEFEDLTRAEIEARRQTWALVKYMRAKLPGFSDSRLIQTAPQIGVRESRRIVGQYSLTGDDVMSGRWFEDTVMVGGYSVDVHGSTAENSKQVQVPAHCVPYRCLVPRDVDGLLVTGRAFSADRDALGALRTTPGVMAMGQAAGTAAALAVRDGVPTADVSTDLLREKLRAQGAVVDLPGA